MLPSHGKRQWRDFGCLPGLFGESFEVVVRNDIAIFHLALKAHASFEIL